MGFDVYRYDSRKLTYIKPLFLLERDTSFFRTTDEYKERIRQLKEKYGTLYTEDYIKTVFVFPYELEKRHIDKLRENGFYKWETTKYEHIFDVASRENFNKVQFAYLLADPIIQNEINNQWSKWKKSNAKLWTMKDGSINPDLFYAARLIFFNRIYEKFGIKYPDKLENILEFVKKRNYDVDKLIDYNIKHGNRNQYASFLPHIGLRVYDEEQDGFKVDKVIELYESKGTILDVLEEWFDVF